MRFTTLIFDLDGTLLDTLADLHASVAHGLRTHGLAERSVAEVRAFLGNGIRNLIERSVPEGTDPPTLEAVFADFRAHYLLHSLDTTQPYPGILELLERLRAAGVRMGIVSNKLDPAVQELNQRFFAHFMQVAVGESPGVRRKPHPDAVLEAMRRLNATPSETLYVGDSEVDYATAQAAGIACALVLWGFRDAPELRELGADFYAAAPADLWEAIAD